MKYFSNITSNKCEINFRSNDWHATENTFSLVVLTHVPYFQDTSSSPRGYPAMMSDIDKFLGDPDQFLSSFSSTFNGGSGDSIQGSVPSYMPVSQAFGDSTSSAPFPSSLPVNSNAGNDTSVAPSYADFKDKLAVLPTSQVESKPFIRLSRGEDSDLSNVRTTVSSSVCSNSKESQSTDIEDIKLKEESHVSVWIRYNILFFNLHTVIIVALSHFI